MSKTKTRKPPLPAARTADQGLKHLLDGAREQLMRWRGDTGSLRDRVVTVGDLVDSEVVKLRDGWSDRSPTESAIEPTADEGGETSVGALDSLQTSPVFEEVILTWDGTNQENYALTEIWRSTEDNLGTAVFRGTAIAAVFADNATPGETYYYWIRAVSDSGQPGSFNATAGTKATTKQRSQFLLDELSGQITESELYQDLNDRIDLVDGPESLTGSVNARVATEKTERQNADDALASDVSTVQANVDDNTAAIQQRSEVKVDGGEVSAQYDLRLQTTVDGQLVMGGFGLASDGSSVEAGFNVDRFWIGQPGVDYSQESKRFPFLVDGGVTYIDEAMIREASIGSAQIAELAAEKINAGTIDVAVNLTAAEITGGSLDINNKFTVDSSGNADIRSGTSGARMEIKNDVVKVFDGNGTLRVQLGNLNA
ncbi:phage tail tip fiber protein [Halofilum ochraceum]|uniref:phage tail tip fiber protein n=1 Tax=Halofilum ochraceum TaxID=1611323 RepID=UPI0008D9D710|nr:DUF1983 domain-containing protein [Halofilum ochraceum]